MPPKQVKSVVENKSAPRRVNARGHDPRRCPVGGEQLSCEQCGEACERRSTYGPTPKYCSAACRRAAWKRRNPEKVRADRRAKARRDMDDPEKRARQYARADRWIRQRREWLDAYRREHGCVDCGIRTGRLDLDHRPGVEKFFSLAHARVPWATLKVELAKCDVRCVSCHAKRHGRERGGLNYYGDESLGTAEMPGAAA